MSGKGSGHGVGGGNTAQRLRLEAISTKLVYETMGCAVPASVKSVLDEQAASATASNTLKRSRHSSTSNGSGNGAGSGTQQLSAKGASQLEGGLRKFYDKLPYNHGAQLCIEDMLSYLRKLVRNASTAGASSDAVVGGLMRYLEEPGFVEHLAAFGKLPKLPYILVFDPYAYQSKPPPTEEVSKAFDPVGFAECAAAGTNTMMPSKAELEALDKELEHIFDEKLPKSKMRCPNPKCRESKFMRYHEEQKRSADEGSSYIYFCALCGHQGRSR